MVPSRGVDTPMESHVLTINAGPLRYVDVNGRQFAIARMTILQPKVLTGSKGALYYPRNEIESVYEEWNGRPLTIKHPNRNGSNVSANSPDIFINQEIGRFYNSKINSDGSNSGEGWFDVELTKRLHSELWNRLEKGEKVEVSTGLYTDNEEAPKNSLHEGTQYTHIARNYRPNHIAILPDEIGACSVKDGCGVFNNNMTHTNNSGCGTGAGGFQPGNDCAKGGGSGGSEGSLDSKIEEAKGQTGEKLKQGIIAYIKKHGAIHSSVGGVTSDKSFLDARIELGHKKFDGSNPLKNPVHKLVKELVDSGHLKVTEVGRGAKIELTDKELESNSTIKMEDISSKDSDDSKVTCAYCGTIQDKPDDGICPNCDKTINYIPNTQDAIMNRQVIIDWLTTNCACYKNADGKKKLEVLNDAALKEILIENAEKGAEVDADQSFLEWIGNADKEIKNAFVSMIKKKLKTAVGSNEFPVKEKKETPGATPPTPEDEEMKKKKMMEEEQANKGTNNQASTMTVEQIQKAIFEHPVFKNIIANHTQNENTEKQKLIGQITATITDNNYKTQVINTLSQKSIDDLRLIASLTPVQPSQQTFPVTNYFGATGAPSEITDNSYLQQEKLVVNEINWDEWSNLNSKVA